MSEIERLQTELNRANQRTRNAEAPDENRALSNGLRTADFFKIYQILLPKITTKASNSCENGTMERVVTSIVRATLCAAIGRAPTQLSGRPTNGSLQRFAATRHRGHRPHRIFSNFERAYFNAVNERVSNCAFFSFICVTIATYFERAYFHAVNELVSNCAFFSFICVTIATYFERAYSTRKKKRCDIIIISINGT